MEACKDKDDAETRIKKIWGDWVEFAKYAFNKSHSVCYAYIAYQTGYLKAHYPANFMCAQISSEIGNFDKMPALVEAAADMGLKVLPPSINASRCHFSPEGSDAIRFGLGAIRGVGEAAGDQIVKEREANGPYKGLVDFCKRLCGASAKEAAGGKALVSKRTIESLIRSGAMACFTDVTMGRLINGIDFAFSCVAEADRAAESGQGSLFDILGDKGESAGFSTEELPAANDLSDKERLQFERDYLGVYLTGHPVDRYRTLVRSFQTVTVEKFPSQCQNRDNVRIAGLLTNVREAISKTTKRPWAELTVDDGSGAMKILAFNDAYANYKELFVVDTPILICGEAKFEEGRDPTLFAGEIYALPTAPSHFAKNIRIRCVVENDQHSADKLEKLRDIFTKYPGGFPLLLVLDLPHHSVIFEPESTWAINPSPECLAEIESICGRNSISYTLRSNDIYLDPKRNRRRYYSPGT
jgi:DNA polymerase-3 subunit alpha